MYGRRFFFQDPAGAGLLRGSSPPPHLANGDIAAFPSPVSEIYEFDNDTRYRGMVYAVNKRFHVGGGGKRFFT